MAGSLFSSLWYRVADIKPRLRGHARISRHMLRGEIWYVLQDNVTGRYHRFNPAAFYLLDKLDGEQDLQSIWESAVNSLGEDAPSQDDVIKMLGQLHAADLLATDVLPDNFELVERQAKQKGAQWKQKLLSPLSIRVPLIDPERFLSRSVGFASPVFGVVGAILWLLVVVSGVFMAVQNLPLLLENVSDTVLTPSNLVLLWLLFPLVKALHEFGHAYATKVWGGEVHEMGIMFLVFMPVPYVDASAASAFPQRYRRVIVGAAGMLVEVFVAALALHFWLLAEPGISRTLAYNIILIGGVSTLVFNINPLLRFDGYYILSDLVEIPNLGARSNRYLGYLIQKYILGARKVRSPVTAAGERAWFVFYSISSFVYRSFVMIAIATFVASKYFFFGVMLALLVVSNMFIVPVFKHVKFMFSSQTLQFVRTPALLKVSGILGLLVFLLFIMPSPFWTNAQGVVWVPEQSHIRAGSDCFVEQTLVEADSHVSGDTRLIECRDPELVAQIALLKARVVELEIDFVERTREDAVQAELIAAELESVQADLNLALERQRSLIVTAPSAGMLSIPLFQDLPGKYFHKGETIGYIVHDGLLMVRTAIPQDDIALVRNRTERVELLISGMTEHGIPARIAHEVPGASNRLPSAALGSLGGGAISVDPREPEGTTTFQKIFQFDIESEALDSMATYGGRVWVRFHHGYEPLGVQWYRSLRQLFLGVFGV